MIVILKKNYNKIDYCFKSFLKLEKKFKGSIRSVYNINSRIIDETPFSFSSLELKFISNSFIFSSYEAISIIKNYSENKKG